MTPDEFSALTERMDDLFYRQSLVIGLVTFVLLLQLGVVWVATKTYLSKQMGWLRVTEMLADIKVVLRDVLALLTATREHTARAKDQTIRAAGSTMVLAHTAEVASRAVGDIKEVAEHLAESVDSLSTERLKKPFLPPTSSGE